MTIAEQLHQAYHTITIIESKIEDVFEKHEPEIYEDLAFNIGADSYDNSIEIYFTTKLPYPYEPSQAVRKEVYDLGFSNVYWNFMEEEHHEEVRNYEPRHYRDSKKWIPSNYGYVDERFNESEWLEKYGKK